MFKFRVQILSNIFCFNLISLIPQQILIFSCPTTEIHKFEIVHTGINWILYNSFNLKYLIKIVKLN